MDFDVVVLGTGLSESIAAAALSKAGFKVAHVDNNPYYGGDEASLTLDELAEWADTRSADATDQMPSNYLANQRIRYTSISRSSTIPPQSRQYSVSLAPSIVPSLGPHIDSLIASGVSRYGSFKLLEKVAVYDRPGYVQSVPGSKEDVFKSKALSLVEKRRLMRFLLFAAGEFEGKKELEGKEQMSFLQFLREAFTLADKPANAIAYALAFVTSPDGMYHSVKLRVLFTPIHAFADATLPALQRIRQYLRSAGRYGASPFLVGHYGGLGETAQGFCRTAAVKGGTYILGRRVLAVRAPPPREDGATQDEKAAASSSPEPQYAVELEEFDEPLTAKAVLSSPDYVRPASSRDAPPEPGSSSASSLARVARCIAVIDRPLVFTPSEAPEETPADLEDSPEAAEEDSSARPAASNNEVDTAVLVFTPGSLENGSSTAAAHVLVTGEGSMSAPRGKWVLSISLPLPEASSSRSAEELLRPYLDATLTLTAPPSASPVMQPVTPLFSVFYAHCPTPRPFGLDIIVTPPHTLLLPTIADVATEQAESMFWKAVQKLGRKRPTEESTGKKEAEDEGPESSEKDIEESGLIDSFWPPLDAAEVESSEDW
ncbi:FAD/NAD(P)-binding domain-containing protein [Pilatotrama ljubarskyi]|nr:FAD/NAD(P)-binding domain-containing protein [Pilatotrama ljubarskyi]